MITTSLALLIVAYIGGGCAGIVGVIAPVVIGIAVGLFALVLILVIIAIVDNIKYNKALRNKKQ